MPRQRNPYIQNLNQIVQSLALQEYQDKRKTAAKTKEQEAQRANVLEVIKRLQQGGLVEGASQPSPASTTISATPGHVPLRSENVPGLGLAGLSGPAPTQPGTTLSVPSGEVGEASGAPFTRKLPAQLIRPAQSKPGVSPFVRKQGFSIDPSTGQMKITSTQAPNPAYVRPQTEREQKETTLKRATTLRKEFDSSPVKKGYQVVERGFKALEGAYEMSISPDQKSRIASDQALGVLFQKMLDPDSVVRESEYARTPEGAAFINRMKAWGPQLAKGGLRLENEDRQAIYVQAQQLLESSQDQYNKVIDRYTALGQEYGVPPAMIFGDIKKRDLLQEGEGSKPVAKTGFSHLWE